MFNLNGISYILFIISQYKWLCFNNMFLIFHTNLPRLIVESNILFIFQTVLIAANYIFIHV